MSSLYEVAAFVHQYDTSKVDVIRWCMENRPVMTEWDIDPNAISFKLRTTGNSIEEEFAEELTTQIWEANNRYCDVQLEIVCLEDTSNYRLTEGDYERLIAT
jgi:hypothetical protein